MSRGRRRRSSVAAVSPWLSRRRRRGLGRRPSAASSASAVAGALAASSRHASVDVDRRHRVALERRRQPRPDEPGPRDRPLAEPVADLVGGLDDAPPARIVGARTATSCSRSPRPDAVTPSSRIRSPRTSGRASSRAVRKIGSVRSVGSGSVRWRVIVRNVESRILTVTVAALTPRVPKPAGDALGHRRGSSARSPRDRTCRRRTCARGRPTSPRRGRRPGRRRCPRARSPSDAPCLPNRRIEQVVGQRGQVADRPDAVLAQRRGRLRADAPQPGDRRAARGTPPPRRAGRRRARPACAGPTRSWRRASSSRRRPRSSGRPRRGPPSLIRRPIASPSPNSAREPVTSRNASSIEIGSTSGVNRRRIAMTSRLTAWYFAPSTGRKMPCGTEPAGRPQRHRRVDAERARLVARRADDAALVRPAAADDDRLAAQLRPVALLDRREERVEVDVEDRPRGLHRRASSRAVRGPRRIRASQPDVADSAVSAVRGQPVPRDAARQPRIGDARDGATTPSVRRRPSLRARAR